MNKTQKNKTITKSLSIDNREENKVENPLQNSLSKSGKLPTKSRAISLGASPADKIKKLL